MLHSTSASPSRHMSGLSIEEDAGEAIEATTGVLGWCRFVAHGAVVLDYEISARGDDDDDAAALLEARRQSLRERFGGRAIAERFWQEFSLGFSECLRV